MSAGTVGRTRARSPRPRRGAITAIVALGLTVVLTGATVEAGDPLIDAAQRGDAETVSSLLASGADANVARGDGLTPLMIAAGRGHADVVELLLSAGASVGAETRIGSYTPLHLASRGGHADIVFMLLEAGADPEAVTTNSRVTPLHLAALAIHGERAVAALLDHGASVDPREISAGQTPLMFAAGADRVEAVRELLRRGADPSISTTVVDVLRHVTTDRAANELLRETIGQYREEADGARGWKPTAEQVQEAIRIQRDFLRSAQAYGDSDPADLVSHRPDYPGGPDVARPPYRETLVGATGGMTALLHAAREGHLEVAAALLEGGADIDQVSGGDHTSPLLIATLNGQFDLAMMLIERGADPNLAATTDGAAPLFATLQTQWAPKSNYPQPRAQDNQETEYLDVLAALLEAGADPNRRLNSHLWYWEYQLTKIGLDLKGATPFYRAALAQDIVAMRMLHAHGADSEIPTAWPAVGMRERRQQDGRQQEDSALPYIPEDAPNAWPIHAAAGGGWLGLGSFSMRAVPGQFIPAVKYLIEELGADVNQLDSWGYTPIHYAASRGDNDMIEYLVSKGADVKVVTRLGQSAADMARGGRAGFFSRVAYPETVQLLQSLGSTLECLHTHFLDTGDFCPLAGVNDPWAQRVISEESPTPDPGTSARPSGGRR